MGDQLNGLGILHRHRMEFRYTYGEINTDGVAHPVGAYYGRCC